MTTRTWLRFDRNTVLALSAAALATLGAGCNVGGLLYKSSMPGANAARVGGIVMSSDLPAFADEQLRRLNSQFQLDKARWDASYASFMA